MLDRVRRLLILISTVVFADTMLFSALIPLLPVIADEHGLSKADAGLLLGAYAGGAVLGGIPSGLTTARFGAQRAVVLGLALLAVSSVAFAFADAPVALGAARFAQGFSSALTWTGSLAWIAREAPRERRGELLGTVFGIAVFGFVIGPVFGAAAHALSQEAAFTAVGVFSVLLAVAAWMTPAAPVDRDRGGSVRSAFRDKLFLTGLWLTFFPAVFFGAMDLLAPLALDEAGWTVSAIAVVFLVAGGSEAGLNPFIGRLADRRGPMLPIRIALACSVVVAAAFSLATGPFAVALLVVLASLAFGGFYTPGMALVSDRTESLGLPLGIGFGLVNMTWSSGAVVGPALGGWLAHLASDGLVYGLTAVVCLVTLVAVLRSPRTAHV